MFRGAPSPKPPASPPHRNSIQRHPGPGVRVSDGVSGALPPVPDAFGLNPPSQLVIGHYWLSFLNQVHKISSQFSHFSKNIEYKIEDFSKNK